MTTSKIRRECRGRIGSGIDRLTIFTTKVSCDRNHELWHFSRMPACGQEKSFITRIACDCDHELWRPTHIHFNTIAHCHGSKHKQKQERF